MQFPTSLYCIELSYSLDDRNVVERLLADFPIETEQCIPSALRQILKINAFLSKRDMVKYLMALWWGMSVNDKLANVGKHGLTHLVDYFLDRKADIHFADDYALRWAADYGHIETVKRLLNRNADIHANDDEPLRVAISTGRTDMVKLLLSRMT